MGFGSKHHLVSILTASDHYSFEKKYDGGPSKRVNQILKIIKDELVLQHYFVEENDTIVVKLDATTMDNPVLKDW